MNITKQRCIHIFPRFRNNLDLQVIREKHDTLYECIEPHITLVFPFESSLTTEEVMVAAREALFSQEPFTVSTSNITAVNNHGYYLFLNIEDGLDTLKRLHYTLHEGALKSYQSPWTLDGSYKPHITLGRFDSQETMEKAFESLETQELKCSTVINRVFVEIIGENDESIIESIIEFGMRI